MNINLKRTKILNDCTLGEMYIDDKFFAHTLEDTFRGESEKVYEKTCIPNGKYKVIVDFSEKFKKKLPHILNVPSFEGVRIHGGNTEEDTLGCPLIGEETDGVGKIWNCGVKVSELTNLIENSKEECLIDIFCEPTLFV